MPNNPAPRPLYRPGGDFPTRTIPITRQPARSWFRVHRSGRPAIEFGLRPHHRFSHAGCPYPVLYAAANVSVCLWEYFGDDVFGGQHVISRAKWAGCSLSRIKLPQLKVCAVNLEATRNAMGVDKASLLAADLNVPQNWGLAVQRHPANFDGIKHTSRFVDLPCLALFEQPGIIGRLHETLLGELNDLDEAVDWLEAHKVALV